MVAPDLGSGARRHCSFKENDKRLGGNWKAGLATLAANSFERRVVGHGGEHLPHQWLPSRRRPAPHGSAGQELARPRRLACSRALAKHRPSRPEPPGMPPLRPPRNCSTRANHCAAARQSVSSAVPRRPSAASAASAALQPSRFSPALPNCVGQSQPVHVPAASSKARTIPWTSAFSLSGSAASCRVSARAPAARPRPRPPAPRGPTTGPSGRGRHCRPGQGSVRRRAAPCCRSTAPSNGRGRRGPRRSARADCFPRRTTCPAARRAAHPAAVPRSATGLFPDLRQILFQPGFVLHGPTPRLVGRFAGRSTKVRKVKGTPLWLEWPCLVRFHAAGSSAVRRKPLRDRALPFAV